MIVTTGRAGLRTRPITSNGLRARSGPTTRRQGASPAHGSQRPRQPPHPGYPAPGYQDPYQQHEPYWPPIQQPGGPSGPGHAPSRRRQAPAPKRHRGLMAVAGITVGAIVVVALAFYVWRAGTPATRPRSRRRPPVVASSIRRGRPGRPGRRPSR
jgi:hypothetical protein